MLHRMRFASACCCSLLLGACGGSSDGQTSDTTTLATSSSSEGGASTSGTTSADSTSSSSSSSGADTSSSTSSSEDSSTGTGVIQVQFETTLGIVVFELDDVAAPITTANFLTYLDGGFFDGTDGNGATIFHRVVPGFVVQGGGLTEALETKTTLPPIVNESGNGLTNVRGAISMARLQDPDTATSQFFVDLVDNTAGALNNLDAPPGYAVFGHVVMGMDVIDAMAMVPTEMSGRFEDVPVDPIIVLSATRL